MIINPVYIPDVSNVTSLPSAVSGLAQKTVDSFESGDFKSGVHSLRETYSAVQTFIDSNFHIVCDVNERFKFIASKYEIRQFKIKEVDDYLSNLHKILNDFYSVHHSLQQDCNQYIFFQDDNIPNSPLLLNKQFLEETFQEKDFLLLIKAKMESLMEIVHQMIKISEDIQNIVIEIKNSLENY